MIQTQLLTNLENKYLCSKNQQLNAYDKQSVPLGYSKLTIGQITEILLKNLHTCSDQELNLRGVYLSKLKAKVENKYFTSFFKKIWLTFLSSLFNLYQGFGFVDSITLINRTIAQINQTSVSYEGEIQFPTKGKILLGQIFSEENLKKIRERAGKIIVGEKEITVTHYGMNIPVFELSDFPGLIFKYPSKEDILPRYESMKQAREVCQEYSLKHLIVPEASLITLADGSQLLVEKKYEFKHGKYAQEKEYANHEKELKEIIRELTILICKTGFADVRWDNIPLYVDYDEDLTVVLIDLESHPKFGRKGGLFGWKVEGSGWPTPGLLGCFPQYADEIYQTIQECLSSEEFDELKEELEKEMSLAHEINAHTQSVEQFHKANGITLDSPAIPPNILQGSSFEYASEPVFSKVIEDINQVIAKRLEERENLVQARQWRLTLDSHTADSNWKPRIYNLYQIILDKLIPFLQKAGVIHLVTKGEEAKRLNLHLKWHQHFDTADYIIQF